MRNLQQIFNFIIHLVAFQLDLTELNYDRWSENSPPMAAELVELHDAAVDAEIMTQSSSQTISIYEALADILTKPTESLTNSNNNRTIVTQSTTSTTTTTTTTTTTEAPFDDLKVENSSDQDDDYDLSDDDVFDDRVNSVVHNQHDGTFNTIDLHHSSSVLAPTFADLLREKRTLSATISPSSSNPTTTEFSTESHPSPSNTTIDIITTDRLTHNVTSEFSNQNFLTQTSHTNKTTVDTIESSLKADNDSQLADDEKSAKVGENFTVIDTSRVSFSASFSGSSRENRHFKSAGALPWANDFDLMSLRVTKKGENVETTTYYPVYKPEYRTSTPKSQLATTEMSKVMIKYLEPTVPPLDDNVEDFTLTTLEFNDPTTTTTTTTQPTTASTHKSSISITATTTTLLPAKMTTNPVMSVVFGNAPNKTVVRNIANDGSSTLLANEDSDEARFDPNNLTNIKPESLRDPMSSEHEHSTDPITSVPIETVFNQLFPHLLTHSIYIILFVMSSLPLSYNTLSSYILDMRVVCSQEVELKTKNEFCPNSYTRKTNSLYCRVDLIVEKCVFHISQANSFDTLEFVIIIGS